MQKTVVQAAPGQFELNTYSRIHFKSYEGAETWKECVLQARLLAKWPLLAPLAILIGAHRLLGLHLLELLKQLLLLIADFLRYLDSYMDLQQTV